MQADDEDGSSDDDDSDGGFEVDVLPPPCYAVHKDRKTFKDSLCRECYEIYVRVVRGTSLSYWQRRSKIHPCQPHE